MEKPVHGIHHITAIAGDAQQNIDFYTKILGLKLVKLTVNFDAPDVYHFYYGDEKGSPGTILTFFPFGKPKVRTGNNYARKGLGQVITTSFSVDVSSIDFWRERFKNHGIRFNAPGKRFNEEFITFNDHDGLGLEMVFSDKDKRIGNETTDIPVDYAIKGFHHAELCVANNDDTIELLVDILNFSMHDQMENRLRLSAGDNYTYCDICCDESTALSTGGMGTVHHIAFRTANRSTQLQLLQKLRRKGLYVTEVKDRQYFHSIYFREPGGILFEIATDEPGFAIDEEEGSLGTSLKLPPWEEKNRLRIEKLLPGIKLQG